MAQINTTDLRVNCNAIVLLFSPTPIPRYFLIYSNSNPNVYTTSHSILPVQSIKTPKSYFSLEERHSGKSDLCHIVTPTVSHS